MFLYDIYGDAQGNCVKGAVRKDTACRADVGLEGPVRRHCG